MAELNLDYYTAKDHYSDGDIEETLLKMAQEGKSFEDLPEEEVSFPMVYHFSGLRENILSWYPLKKADSVLEIGAGCGAITGMLCRKAGHVTSVELSKRRADINYARNRDKENLTIMVGNLNDMTFPEKFDYVVVNGVLEYAMSFTEGKTPYETFLQRIGAYLKPEGRLLIAIENRLGLKYFAGAPEDHTDLHFFGINGYPGNQSVRTFSKNELGELLENSGFPFLRFYYPYPDYKFPTEIFTDESLYTNSYGRSYPVYTDKTADLFAESEGVKAFEKEKILDSFVNSFLVEAGRTENRDPEEILYVKLNQERKEKFCLLTRIVRKKRLWCPRLRNLWKNWKKPEQRVPDLINTRIFPAGQKTERSLIRSLPEKLFTRKSQSLPRKKILKRSRPFLKNSIRNFSGLVRLWITGPESSVRYLVIIREEMITNASARPMWI